MVDAHAELRQIRADEWRRVHASASGSVTAGGAIGHSVPVTPAEGPHDQDAREGGGEDEGDCKRASVREEEHSEEARCCRICFDSDETVKTGRLFSPCKCTGSMQYVHVRCLDAWRVSAVQGNSYYRCDACHYEYRLERLQFAEIILSHGAQILVTFVIFLAAASMLGVVFQCIVPSLLTTTVEKLQLPPAMQALFIQQTGKGNPDCWHDGFTYDLCCSALDKGNSACWDATHSFEVCCKGVSDAWQRVAAVILPSMQILANGLIALSAVGFAMFLWRQIHENWGDANGQWHLIMMAMSFATLNQQALVRLGAFLGSSVALRELYFLISKQAKWFVTACGDRVLEVS